MMRVLVPRPQRSLILVLATLCAASAADLPEGIAPGRFEYECPEPELSQGVMVAKRGFVARKGDWTMAADSARYDQRLNEVYAKGHVVLVIPGVRIHAERLGINHQTETGDAWNVEVFVEQDDRRVTFKAQRCHFDRRHVVLDGVSGNGGHGSILGLSASRVHIYLREKPAETRTGIARQVEGIGMSHVRGEMMGVPIIYLPYVYRDFILSYPWTRYEVGASKRQGSYLHSWVGSDLPMMGNWKPGLDARGDLHSRNGEAMGLKGYWENTERGYGEISWYRIPHESVHDPNNNDQIIAERGARTIDAEHRMHAAIDGMGSGAVSARWVSLPPADIPGTTNLGPGPDERFRGDFLYDDLDSRPLARRGITATWGIPLGTLTLDTERHAQESMPTTERWWGVETTIPNACILGPLFVTGSTWTERLRKRPTDNLGNVLVTDAVRTTFDGALGVMKWFGAFGADAASGLRGITYQNGVIANTPQTDNTSRHIPYGTAGLRMRVVDDYDGGYQHAITPRIGIQALGIGQGDVLPAYQFGDPRDILEEDKRYGVGEVSTEVTRGGSALFMGSVVSRWALRDQERTYLDDTNTSVVNSHRLVDVAVSAQGSPTSSLSLTGNALYNALLGTWSSLDASAQWAASTAFFMRYRGTLLPTTPYRAQVWQHWPGLSLLANRYRYDFDCRFQPGGAAMEEWRTQINRRMVDGELFLFAEFIRNDDGSVYDKRVGIGFSMTPQATVSPTPDRSGTQAAFRPRSSIR